MSEDRPPRHLPSPRSTGERGGRNADRPPLVEVLLRQRRAWEKGKALRVEELLDLYPHLRTDTDAVLDLVYNEVLLREESGQPLAPEDYYRRFPELAPALRAQFEVEEALTLGRPTEQAPAPGRLPRLDGCELLDEIGRGAMGVIYRGWQTAARRPVAVKLLSRDVPSGRVRVEAEAASRLSHRNIVQVYEVKEHEGRTALVLEYVEGGNLAQKLAGRPQPPAAAARLVEALAEAMAYAHSRGVIHRDLKPSNVLLSCGPDEPLSACVPKISDFGLAKLVEGGPRLTATRDVLGTPSYMAPEQTGTSPSTVGPLADVYALGAILYECLTGRPPFLGQSVLDTLDQVRHQEPVPPSRLQPRIPRDLETICLKCLHKQPERRYPAAAALAEDLRRFQQGRPILGRPVGPLERGWKWARRRPAVAALLLAGLASLLLLGGAGVKVNQVLRHQRDLARGQAEQLDAQLRHTRRLLYTAQLLRVGSVWESDPEQGLRMLEDEAACPPDLRCFSWGVLLGQCKRYRTTVAAGPGTVTSVLYHPSNRLLAYTTTAGAVVLLDGDTGREAVTLRSHGPAATRAAFRPDGTLLAVGTADGFLLLWEVPSGKPAGRWNVSGRVGGLAWHPDGQTLVLVTQTAEKLGQLRVWDVPTGRPRFELAGKVHPSSGVAVSADGQLIAAGGADHALRVWEMRRPGAGTPLRGHTEPLTCLAFAGKKLVSGALDGTVRVWDLEREQELDRFTVATGPVLAMALHPAGQVLAVAGAGQADTGTEAVADVQLWDLVSRRGREPLRGHAGGATALAFSSDGRALATAGADGTLKLWDHPGRREQLTLRGHDGAADTVALSADGRALAWISKGDRPGVHGQEVHVADLNSGETVNTFHAHGRPIQAVALAADGRHLAVAAGHVDEPAELLVWEVRGRRLVQALSGHPREVAGLVFCPGDKGLISAGRDGVVRRWDVETGKEVRQFRVEGQPLGALAWDRDGRWLAVAGGGPAGGVVLYDLEGGEAARRITLAGGVRCLALSGGVVAFATAGGVVGVVDLEGGEERQLTTGMKEIVRIALSRDARTLAVAGSSTGVKLWDVPTGQERASLPRHRGGACFAAFADDGRLLVTASAAQAARLWHCLGP